MSGCCNECSVREVLVFFSLDDNAPQRVRLKIHKNIVAEDIFRQITLQLFDPGHSKPSDVVPRVSIPPDAQIFAFSKEENCFVPIDGKAAHTLKDFTRLLIHTSGEFPVSNGGVLRASPVSSSVSYIRHPQMRSRPSTGQRPFFCQTRKNSSPFHSPPTSLFQPAGASDRRADSKETVNEEGAKSQSVSFTVKLMLDVTGFLLREYSARAVEDVFEPTWENLQVLVEDTFSCYNSGFSSRLLDVPTMEAFMETFLSSLRIGRMCRASAQLLPLKENVKDV